MVGVLRHHFMSPPAFPTAFLFESGSLQEPQTPVSCCGKSLGFKVILGFQFRVCLIDWLSDLEQVLSPSIWCSCKKGLVTPTQQGPCRIVAMVCTARPSPTSECSSPFFLPQRPGLPLLAAYRPLSQAVMVWLGPVPNQTYLQTPQHPAVHISV